VVIPHCVDLLVDAYKVTLWASIYDIHTEEGQAQVDACEWG